MMEIIDRIFMVGCTSLIHRFHRIDHLVKIVKHSVAFTEVLNNWNEGESKCRCVDTQAGHSFNPDDPSIRNHAVRSKLSPNFYSQ